MSVSNPIFFFRSQLKSLAKIDCERIADNTFFEIKLLFFSDEIKIDSIRNTDIKNSEYFFLEDEKVILSKSIVKPIKRSYKLSYKEKTTTKEETFRLITVLVFLSENYQKKPYMYEFNFLSKKSV